MATARRQRLGLVRSQEHSRGGARTGSGAAGLSAPGGGKGGTAGDGCGLKTEAAKKGTEGAESDGSDF